MPNCRRFEDLDGMRTVETADRAVSDVLPGTTLARLVMVHWRDSKTNGDCYSREPLTGYLTDTCLSMFDNVVEWATGAGLWITLTSRAAEAAGDGGPGRTVFNNVTLADQMVAMWRFLAKRYANTDFIAGYEVMSEPRTEGVDIVHPFQQRACDAVKSADPMAICFVGPAKFYDRLNLGPRWLIQNNSQVIYAVNFFVPKLWITSATTIAATTKYGQQGMCCNLAEAKTCAMLSSGCNTTITLGKDWLENQLTIINEFKANYSVPVWIDQWGIWQAVGGRMSSQTAYLTDVLNLFEAHALHWAYWLWKDPWGEQHCTASPEKGDYTYGFKYAMMCKLNNGTEHKNIAAITTLGKFLKETAQSASENRDATDMVHRNNTVLSSRRTETSQLWRCTSDASCQLNGKCESNGHCTCDPGWVGTNCSALQLGESRRAYTGRTSDTTTWGGRAVEGDDGKWHGFFTELTQHCTLSAWTTNSEIVHAIADKVEGPYTFSNVVQVPWSHNPAITREPTTGDYLIAHIGCGNSTHVDAPKNCSSKLTFTADNNLNSSVMTQCVRVNELLPPCGCPKYGHSMQPVACQTLQILRSSSPFGPFKDRTVAWPINSTTTWPGCISNPSLLFPLSTSEEDNLVLLGFNGNLAPPNNHGPTSKPGLFASTTGVEGKFIMLNGSSVVDGVRQHYLTGSRGYAEDPVLWRDPRGMPHMLLHGFYNLFPGGHGWSTDPTGSVSLASVLSLLHFCSDAQINFETIAVTHVYSIPFCRLTDAGNQVGNSQLQRPMDLM